MLHAYIGAILLDSQDVEKTFFVVKGIMDDYLLNNATVETYSEHPKVIILDEFFKKAHYLKKLREK
jgi:dsRNA-specific ribonuclease